jgi:multiple sugar transport system substrate-binding protein/putative aldouronate transport system substrate-binding protein
MKKLSKQIFSGLLVSALILSPLAGCANNTSASSEAKQGASTDESAASQTNASATSKKYEKTIEATVFDTQANYQGVQTGWFGNIVKDKFNMTLNLIAPNVAGGGDTLFKTRSAAGNLGDIIMIGSENGRLSDTAKAGLLVDLTDKINNCPNLSQYPKATEMVKSLVTDGKVYAMPSQVSKQSPTTPSEGYDLTYGPYIRWDYYTAMGSPEINSMDDLLNVLKDMQKKYPKSDSGKKTYAFSFFKDWDGNMMCCAKNLLCCVNGYDEQGFQFLSADGKTEQSIIDEDSYYVKALKYMYKANQMGLVDPDSTTQNYDTMYSKYQDGQILYSMWPWLGQAAYNTPAHKKAGKGFMLAPVKGIKIFSYGCSQAGNKYVIGIGSKAQDPGRMLDFIDWLYSPEGVEMSCSQTAGSCGPKGLTWEMKDNKPVLTDFGKQALSGEKINVPSKWGTGTWKNGISQLNFQAVQATDTDPNTNCSYNYTLWDSYLEDNKTPLDTSWQTTMKAKTTLEYLKQNDAYVVAPGNAYVPEAAGTEIDTLRNQCKAIIIQDSWKMAFAKDESEFNSLLQHMQKTVKGLGYDKVLAFDQKISDNYKDAREKATQGS